MILTACDFLKTGPQVLRADTKGASYSTAWTFFFSLLNPVSVKNFQKRFGGRPIDPGRGTADQTGCLANSFQFREPPVYRPVHSAAPAGLELNSVIAPALPECLLRPVPVQKHAPQYPPVQLPVWHAQGHYRRRVRALRPALRGPA